MFLFLLCVYAGVLGCNPRKSILAVLGRKEDFVERIFNYKMCIQDLALSLTCTGALGTSFVLLRSHFTWHSRILISLCVEHTLRWSAWRLSLENRQEPKVLWEERPQKLAGPRWVRCPPLPLMLDHSLKIEVLREPTDWPSFSLGSYSLWCPQWGDSHSQE